MALKPEDRVMVLAPVVRGRKGEFKQELEKLVQHGYTRARIDGELVGLEDGIALDKRKNHKIEVVVDRLLVKPRRRTALLGTSGMSRLRHRCSKT
jgi:excinuclease ABC subunit A